MGLFSQYLMFKKPLNCKMTKFAHILNDAQLWEGTCCRNCNGKASMISRRPLHAEATDEEVMTFKMEDEHQGHCSGVDDY